MFGVAPNNSSNDKDESSWQIRECRGASSSAKRYKSEQEARAAFDGTWFSSLLLDPNGKLVAHKLGAMDVRSSLFGAVDDLNMAHELADSPLNGRRDSFFFLGYFRPIVRPSKFGVFWRTFDFEEEAQEIYELVRWSKALFHSSGRILRIMTSPADKDGIGTAAVLKAYRDSLSNQALADDNSLNIVASEVKSGNLPFVPPARPNCIQMVTMAMWKLFGYSTCLRFGQTVARGLRFSRGPVLCSFDAKRYKGVKGFVALTIDDVPCRHGKDEDMLKEVQSLLEQYNARATFMLMGKYVNEADQDLVDLLQSGHEFANHGLIDQPYDKFSYDDFKEVVDECSNKIKALQKLAGVPEEVRWFRSPWARTSAVMSRVLREKHLVNVLCDSYACCPVIQDGDFIGNFIANSARDGSIIVIHMPEVCSREWCFRGLEVLLKGLAAKNLQAVSLGTLAEKAGWDPRQMPVPLPVSFGPVDECLG
eukprot:TRINITY_DN38483_c0_g1_i1.p1 TRINITY_DN38483_c0_g1~~TRINITY_DN38483_c0_g1_i1.p1  ORF type:complete len:478 (-),score=58.91 TRINITY_DN38483_c0_g1_i1:256-1689(-)